MVKDCNAVEICCFAHAKYTISISQGPNSGSKRSPGSVLSKPQRYVMHLVHQCYVIYNVICNVSNEKLDLLNDVAYAEFEARRRQLGLTP